MSYNDDLKAIEDDIRSLVRTYDPATEDEYERRSQRHLDAWKERGYEIYNADVRLDKDESGETVGVTLLVRVFDRREKRTTMLEVTMP